MATKASEKLAKLRERNKPKGSTYVEPTLKAHASGFSRELWYDKIRADPSVATVQAAGEYYATAVQDGTHYVVPVGNLETLMQQHPGITFFYQSILVDCQQSRRWMEDRQERLEAGKHNYYMHDEEAKSKHGVLKTTEASKMAKADEEVMAMAGAVRILAYHEHNLDALMAAFDNIKYMLNNVVTTRKEGLEEVWVDPTSETNNA